MQDDRDMDDWLAGLSGRRPPRHAFDEAATLRQVLLREQQEAAADAIRPGEDASISELTRKRILRRLRAEPMPAQGAPSSYRRIWVAAASFLLVVFATTLVWQPWQSAGQVTRREVTRGVVGGLNIVSPEPDAEARRILAELQLLGLPATRQDDSRVRIEVTTSAGQLPRFGEWMERHGGSARAAGVYEIVIEPPPRP
jgi:hypothetical protein